MGWLAATAVLVLLIALPPDALQRGDGLLAAGVFIAFAGACAAALLAYAWQILRAALLAVAACFEIGAGRLSARRVRRASRT